MRAAAADSAALFHDIVPRSASTESTNSVLGCRTPELTLYDVEAREASPLQQLQEPARSTNSCFVLFVTDMGKKSSKKLARIFLTVRQDGTALAGSDSRRFDQVPIADQASENRRRDFRCRNDLDPDHTRVESRLSPAPLEIDGTMALFSGCRRSSVCACAAATKKTRIEESATAPSRRGWWLPSRPFATDYAGEQDFVDAVKPLGSRRRKKRPLFSSIMVTACFPDHLSIVSSVSHSSAMLRP